MSKWDDLSGVYDNVFSTETNFDYEDWTDEKKGMTRVKFLNVPWDKEYNHIVDWDTDENRDTWFDNKEGYVYEYETGWNFKSLETFNHSTNRHTGFIQVDAVYEAIQGFNYIKVEMYKQPVETDLPRREVYYYFITSSNKLNPNTTQVFIELDTWTTYKNSIDINGLKLKRGHLPHTLTNATKFLNDPLNNQYGITEVEPELPNIKQLVSNEKLISFQKNEPRVCIATTADLSKPRDQWLMNREKYNFRTPSFTPSPADKWWYQVHENSGVGWQGGPEDYYPDGLAPIPNVGSQAQNGGVPTVRTYSMTPEAYLQFVSIARKRLPQLLSTIQAVFLLDTSLIQEGNSINFYGVSVKPVQQQNSVKIIEEFKPSKEDFNYSEVYSDFAKLYTNQFAVLEVSNMNGKKVEISIEDISESLEFYSRSSSVFPFLKLEAFINGVGGKEKTTYAVKPWNEQNSELFKSNWEDFLFEIDVPTYGIFAEATEYNGPKYQEQAVRNLRYNTLWNEPLPYDVETMDDPDEYYDRSVSQLESIFNYRISERDAQVSYDNSILSAETKYNNNDATIANTYENTERSIDKDYENSSDSIEKTYDNTIDSLSNDLSVGTLNMNNTFVLKQADANWVESMGVFNYNIQEKNIEQDQANIEHSLNMSIIPIENQIENNEEQTIIALRGMLAHKENSIWYNDSTYEYKRDIEHDRYNSAMQVTNASSRLNLGMMVKTGAISGLTTGMQAISGAAGATHSVGGISGMGAASEKLGSGINNKNVSDMAAGISGMASAVPTGLWTSAANMVGNFVTSMLMVEPMFNNYQDMYLLENAGSSEWGDIEIEREFDPILTPGEPGFTVSYNGPSMAYINYKTQYDINTEALAMANARLNYVYEIDYDLAWDVFYQERDYSNSMITDYTTETTVYAASREVRSGDINTISNKDIPEAEYAYLLNKATIDRDNTQEVIDEIYDTGAGIAYRTQDIDKSIRDRTKNVEDTINESTRTVSDYVNQTVYNTERGIAWNERDRKEKNYINRYEHGNLNDLVSNIKHKYALQMNQNDSLLKFYNAPEMYGENTGSAWLDTWGQRGLDVRVKRCSVDIEKSAGNLFYRYGYRTPELWVEEPTLSLMSHFTYWQATDLWITANAVNETNKQIIREIFIKGATVWKDPDEVCSVKITDNKSI